MKSSQQKIGFIPSKVVNGKKYRVVADQVYLSSQNTSFHHFLDEFAVSLFGGSWWVRQETLERKYQSHLFLLADNFIRIFLQIRKKSPEQKIIEVPCSGSTLQWMSLGYDLLCLKHIFAFPPQEIIERLKQNHNFQGARYEIAVAALLARAGFRIRWLEPKSMDRKGKPYCEFVAVHRKSGESFSVEVKSCHGQNARIKERAKKARSFLLDAFKQAPESEGFIVFIDLNIPYCPSASSEKNTVLEELQVLANRINGLASKIPPSLSLTVFTNFPFYYDPPEALASPSEYCFGFLCDPKYKISPSVLGDLEESLKRYGEIPRDL